MQVNLVRRFVSEPIFTALKLHENPRRLLEKRDKRAPEFARYKTMKAKGDKIDKKAIEQAEQFININDLLKDEVPKMMALTGNLVEACLNNYVQLQLQFHSVWRRKLLQAIDDGKGTMDYPAIVSAFSGEYGFASDQVLALGICNGSLLADAPNLISFVPSTTPAEETPPRQTSSMDLPYRRATSMSSEKSPVLPKPDFGGGRGSGSFFEGAIPLASPPPTSSSAVDLGRRMRANSAMASSPRTPEIPGSFRSYSNSITPVATPRRPNTSTPHLPEPSPTLPRQSIEQPGLNRVSDDATLVTRTSSPSNRYSGFFSSAMPMSDSPRSQSPTIGPQDRSFNVIFLAASVYEFNIDRARKEAGYPYLTYVAGEIFDVIGEKGELWLAKNQDDANNMVGWIWNKHFVKLAA